MPEEPIDRIVERMLEGDDLSRRTFLRRLGTAGFAVSGAATLLAACGGAEGGGDEDRDVDVTHPKVPIRNWTFSNWPLYIDPAVIKDFDRRFGARTKYIQDINDNQEFFGKVRQQLQRNQPIGRDLVVLTDYMAARWVRGDYVEPIDKRNVPNLRNLQDNLRSPKFDPERNFTLPWQSGMTGIGYNRKRTGREIRSVDDLFDPRFKGRVTMLEDPHDSAGLVLWSQGVRPEEASIDQVLAAIDKIDEENRKGQIRRFTGNDYTQDLTQGNSWIATVYSGDVFQLREDNPDIEFVIPEEGGVIWTDNMMIPERAAHPYAAETMMNYVYDPKVAAKIAAYVNYVTPVKGVQEELAKSDPELARETMIFPDAATRRKLSPYPDLDAEDERRMIEAMARVTGA